MDEPCSALDPISTLRIEELIDELKQRFTIVIVTHNMQQAARVADSTAFMLDGELVEVGADRTDLHQPERRTHRGVRHREVRLIWRRESHSRQELQELEDRALEGLDMVVTTLERAMEALAHQDVELAAMVVVDDDRIDGRYLEVHQGILSLLARQAPVATDLRLVAALLDVIKHVERMGDQCVNIAKMIPVTGHEPPTDRAMLDTLARDGSPCRLARGAVEASVLQLATSSWHRTSWRATSRSTGFSANASGSRSRSVTTPIGGSGP